MDFNRLDNAGRLLWLWLLLAGGTIHGKAGNKKDGTGEKRKEGKSKMQSVDRERVKLGLNLINNHQ